MRERRGFTLAAAVIVCIAALAILAEIMLSVNRVSEVQISGMRRLKTRTALSSAAAVGRRRLVDEIASGRLPSDARPSPQGAVLFDGVAGEASFRVFDLDYDASSVPDEAWESGEFPPPMRGAFLIRAECSGMMLETVYRLVEVEMPNGRRLFVLDDRPLERREIWR